MIKNYVITSLRNFSKHKFYTFINVFGLAIGICCSILILLWVHDEVTYDRFLPKYDRLYQVWVNAYFDEKINTWNSMPLPTYSGLKDADHNIVNTVSTDWGGEHLLSVGEKKLKMTGYYVSEEFLEMFQFPLKYGDASIVLDDPGSIVITEATAKAFFGDEDPINKMINVDDKGDLMVSGILYDLPENSSFDFEYLLPWAYWKQISAHPRNNEDNWGNYSFQVYVELTESAKEKDVEEAIFTMLKDNGEDDFPSYLHLNKLKKH